MTENPVATAKANVMLYDGDSSTWIPSGSGHGVSKVQLYHNPSANTYRIVGWRLQDREVVINCAIVRGLKYHQARPTFHQWRDSKQRVYGLNFTLPEEAEAFATAVRSALDDLAALHRQQAAQQQQQQQQQQSQQPTTQPVHQLQSQNSAPAGPITTNPSQTSITIGNRVPTSSHDVPGSRSTDPAYHDPTGHGRLITGNYVDMSQHRFPNPHAINAAAHGQAQAVPNNTPTPAEYVYTTSSYADPSRYSGDGKCSPQCKTHPRF
ncbi:Vasodilator-stimulated phosphoprotein [Fasciolopsis buskii]|uniref:Vasodilator-stimulated phosphoprotein n=1 Tax=Fasciolopsis buskii TaxID=27845 RepID=A0A8E0RYQ7_9TREM|nr:Vasodilator-stimulated phosphoprotein [Fasciolopsis buski]